MEYIFLLDFFMRKWFYFYKFFVHHVAIHYLDHSCQRFLIVKKLYNTFVLHCKRLY